MAATVVTREPFPEATHDELEREKELRIKAGAIRCWIEEDGEILVLCTEWNVIGEQ